MGAIEWTFLCQVALFMLLSSCLGGERCLNRLEEDSSKRPSIIRHAQLVTVRREWPHWQRKPPCEKMIEDLNLLSVQGWRKLKGHRAKDGQFDFCL